MSLLDNLFRQTAGVELVVAPVALVADGPIAPSFLYEISADVADLTLTMNTLALSAIAAKRFAIKAVGSTEGAAGDLIIEVPDGTTIEDETGTFGSSTTIANGRQAPLYREWFCSPDGTWLLVTPPITGFVVAAATYENGGPQELDLTGMAGQLVTPQLVEIAKAGALIGTRKRINLIEGTNVTLTVADNPGADRVDVTINASGGASAVAYAVQTGGSSVATHPTKVDLPGLAAFSVSAIGTYLLEVRAKFVRNPAHTTANLSCDVHVLTGSITKAQEEYWYTTGATPTPTLVLLTPSIGSKPALPAAVVPVYVKFNVQLQVTALSAGAATFAFRFGSDTGATTGDQIQCDDATAVRTKLT